MTKYLTPLLFFVLVACNQDTANVASDELDSPVEESNITKNDAVQEKTFSYVITFVEATGYGYQILEDDHLLINQTHIPAVPGIKGFLTKEKAETTAIYILDQVENGTFPPTITKEKLEELGVL